MNKIKIQQKINKGDIPSMYELLYTYTKKELAEKLHKYLLKIEIMKFNETLNQ